MNINTSDDMRKPYEPPAVHDLGSVTEVTRGDVGPIPDVGTIGSI